MNIGDTIYRGLCYWAMEPKEEEQLGWNTTFIPYEVIKITAKRITVTGMANGMWQTLNFKRDAFDSAERVYHSRFHEYFYKEKPARDPEHRDVKDTSYTRNLNSASALLTLGLTHPTTKAQVKAAYKKKARSCHPDFGGDHEAFIKLKSAYDEAMRRF